MDIRTLVPGLVRATLVAETYQQLHGDALHLDMGNLIGFQPILTMSLRCQRLHPHRGCHVFQWWAPGTDTDNWRRVHCVIAPATKQHLILMGMRAVECLGIRLIRCDALTIHSSCMLHYE